MSSDWTDGENKSLLDNLAKGYSIQDCSAKLGRDTADCLGQFHQSARYNKSLLTTSRLQELYDLEEANIRNRLRLMR